MADTGSKSSSSSWLLVILELMKPLGHPLAMILTGYFIRDVVSIHDIPSFEVIDKPDSLSRKLDRPRIFPYVSLVFINLKFIAKVFSFLFLI